MVKRRGCTVALRFNGQNLRIFSQLHVFLVPVIGILRADIGVVSRVDLRLRADQTCVESGVQPLLEIFIRIVGALHLRARAAGGDLHGGLLGRNLVFNRFCVQLGKKVSLLHGVSDLDENRLHLIGKRRIDLGCVAALYGAGCADARLQIRIGQHLRIGREHRLRIAALFAQQKTTCSSQNDNRQHQPALFEFLFLPPGLDGSFLAFFHGPFLLLCARSCPAGKAPPNYCL